MLRTLVLSLVGAWLIAAAWLRLGEGDGGTGALWWLVGLAVLPALAPTRRRRIAAATVAGLAGVAHIAGTSPLDARPFDSDHDFFGPVVSRFARGFLDFYDVTVPYEPDDHVLMHAVVLLAIFAFALALAQAVAARRPLAAAAIVVVGAGWPATLLPLADETRRGALVLAVVLLLFVAAREGRRSLPPLALPVGAVVVLFAVVLTGIPAVAKAAFLDWKEWDPYNRAQNPVSVRYVWDANYDGVSFPKNETTVLKIKAPGASLYWRSTTLDSFFGDRWIETVVPVRPGADNAPPLEDPLLPAIARDQKNWIRADVTVAALRDNHLVGASIPVRYETGDVGRVRYMSGGVALTLDGLAHDQRYRVWSYATRPTPAQLARSRARYPADLARFLSVEARHRLSVPPLSAPKREAAVARLFEENIALQPYRALHARARAVVGRPASPYAAAVALENWFRTTGGFRYDEQPPRGEVALVDFVTRTKRGYCQHFAGAMALMLRYLGIPARVAVGFTSGTYDEDDETWTVTDHNAHAWVEVWFDGYGWLPFDPTPGRGRLSATYTSSSLNFDLVGAAAALAARVAGPSDLAPTNDLRRSRLRAEPPDGALGEGDRGAFPVANPGGSSSVIAVLAGLVVAFLALVALAKAVLRRARYLTGDPRTIASACRKELTAFLADQRVHVPATATLSELVDALDRELGVGARFFADAVTAARFGPPDHAATSARHARRELRRLERELRRELGRFRRARGLVSLRSLALAR